MWLRRERELSVVAAHGRGVVTRAQLVALGYANTAISRRVRAGRLHRLHPGVYAVGHASVSREGRWLAAVLAVGDGAALSHRSAAGLWDLSSVRAKPDVTTARRGRRAPAGIDLHRTRWLPPEHVTVLEGIPVTTVERTLADLAAVVSPGRLERAIAVAEARAIVDVDLLLACARHRPGARAIRSLLAEWTPGVTRSELENRLLALIGASHLPPPEVNAMAEGFEVDLLWRAAHVVVEADGHAFHGSRSRVERDRTRDAALAAAGYVVLRFTWRQVTRRPETVIRAVRAAITR